jgi:histidinol-phosphate phosphatase family protein
MQLVILAGGNGTRLKRVSGDLPKPLVEMAGIPLIGRQIIQAAQSNIINEVLVLTGYGAEKIEAYVNGHNFKILVSCVAESVPRGTAGAVYDCMSKLRPEFMVMYADTVNHVDLKRFVDFHYVHEADATLFLHPNDHPADSDLVETDQFGRIIRFHPYPHPHRALLPNLVNAAMYIIRRDALGGLGGLPERPDFGKNVFPAMLAAGRKLAGYRSPEYIKDAGTPERLTRIAGDIASGLVASRSLRQPSAAVFLDRDGVLNASAGHISSPQKLTLLPGVPEAVGRLNRSFFRTVVVTNQPVVARGEATIEQLMQIHAKLDTDLGHAGAYIDALYFCPHHPEAGHSGEVTSLKIDCDCRKPKTGMLDKASADLNIALEKSWMVGDTTSDMEMARRAGMRSILVCTGEGGRDGKYDVPPDFRAENLLEAVDIILRN